MMKQLLLAAALAAAVGSPVLPAEARTLEEILREKGVITEEDYREAVEEREIPSYTPGKGITIATRDGKTTAQVGGRLQARYTFEDLEAGEDASDFSIRRMKVWLQGNIFSEALFYKFQHDFGEGESDTEEAYAGYRFADTFALTVGQFKVPQGRQELTSSGAQLFVDRSLANDTFNLGRDIGLMVSGEFAGHRLAYMAGIFNGNGPNQGNAGNDHMIAGRIDFHPLGEFKPDEAGWPEEGPLLNLGVSYARETMTAADAGEIDGDNDLLDRALDLGEIETAGFAAAFGDELAWEVCTANLHLRWLGATLAGEYYHLDADPEAGGGWNADGYYLQAGYQVLPSTLELAVRYSAIESTEGDAFARFDRSETQAGVNYYFARHNAKLQADYTRADDDLEADRDDDIIRLQAQVIF